MAGNITEQTTSTTPTTSPKTTSKDPYTGAILPRNIKTNDTPTSAVPEVTDQTYKKADGTFDRDAFQRDLASAPNTIIDLSANWCGPCRQITPWLNKIEQEYGDKLKIIKVNVDKSSAIVKELEAQESQQTGTGVTISSIPHLAVFKNGQLQRLLIPQKEGEPKSEVAVVGNIGEEQFRKVLTQAIGLPPEHPKG